MIAIRMGSALLIAIVSAACTSCDKKKDDSTAEEVAPTSRCHSVAKHLVISSLAMDVFASDLAGNPAFAAEMQREGIAALEKDCVSAGGLSAGQSKCLLEFDFGTRLEELTFAPLRNCSALQENPLPWLPIPESDEQYQGFMDAAKSHEFGGPVTPSTMAAPVERSN